MDFSQQDELLNQAKQPDIHSSTPEYADRFKGKTGEWLLSVQDKCTLKFLDDAFLQSIGAGAGPLNILDIGGGHGQNISAILSKGHKLTIYGSDPSCSQLLKTQIENGSIEFKYGPLTELPFADNSFDIVICYRVLSHIDDWQKLIKETSRTAKSLVIVDYPTLCSFNVLSQILFSIKLKIEKNTRRYRVFRKRHITTSFCNNGFKQAGQTKQFFLPMGLHRALKRPTLSRCLEGAFSITGIAEFFGSPVIACFVPII